MAARLIRPFTTLLNTFESCWLAATAGSTEVLVGVYDCSQADLCHHRDHGERVVSINLQSLDIQQTLGTKITINLHLFALIIINYLHMFLRPQAWLLAIQLVGVFVKQHSKRALANSEHVILKMTNRIFWTCAKVIPSQSCWTVQSQSCVVSFFLCSAGKVQFTVVVFNMF